MGRERFTVTVQHIALLERMYVSHNGVEFGAPSVDPKRPYGNHDVLRDMAEILGMEVDEEEGPDDGQREILLTLHGEMETVLQILLNNASRGIRPGGYSTERYMSRWEFEGQP